MIRTRSSEAVGVIGLGIIGSRVARALRAKGFRVFAWSRTPKPEPGFVASPSEVARAARTIQLFVSDANAARKTVAAMESELTADHLVLCHATIGKRATLDLADSVAKTGATLLDAPFTGSRIAAENSALHYYVAGPADALARARPVLEASSKSILPMGRTGDAALVKVATNLITAATGEALSEALAMVVAHGVDPARFAEALSVNAIRSSFIDMKLPNMIAGDFTPHFSLKHMLKDVRLAIESARDSATGAPLAEAVETAFAEGVRHGWGEDDFTGIARLHASALHKA